MFGVVSFNLGGGKDVDGDDLSFLDDVEHVRHEKAGASGPGAALDNQIWSQTGNQLLVYPEIEGALQHRRGVPICMAPYFGVIIEIVELANYLCTR